MKIIYLFTTLFAVLFVFYSCNSSKKGTSKLTDNKPQELVFLNAGSCFGKCKVYQLKILKSGGVNFTAIKNFEQLGESTFNLKKSKLKDLIMLFEEKGFSELNNEYLSGVKDLQTFEISYKGKSVKFHKMKAPQELINILDFLSLIIKENG